MNPDNPNLRTDAESDLIQKLQTELAHANERIKEMEKNERLTFDLCNQLEMQNQGLLRELIKKCVEIDKLKEENERLKLQLNLKN